jgi:hypothetical protein
MTTTLSDRLKDIKSEVSQKRDQLASLKHDRDKAKARLAEDKRPASQLTASPAFKEAERVGAAIEAVQDEVQQLEAAERGVLQVLGQGTPNPGRDGNGPSDGFNGGNGGDGWAQLAAGLDLREHRTRADVGAMGLLRAAVGVTPDSALPQPALREPLAQLGQDRRYLYPTSPRKALDGSLAISDYRQVGERLAADVVASADSVTVDGEFSDDDRVIFTALAGSGGAPLATGVVYFVRDATPNTATPAGTTFKLAETDGGSAIDITANADAEVINLNQRGRTVEGEIERDPIETTVKANLGLSLAYVNDPVRQFAILANDVPAKLLDSEILTLDFLRQEMQWQLERALDQHLVERILDSGPLSGSTGSDLIAKVRNAVAAMNELGANPSVLALSPADAAALDLTQVGADDLYLFLTRDVGSASPIWSLRIAEVPGLTDPIVLDPVMTGTMYVGNAAGMLNPYSGASQNLVQVRLEFEALAHIRNADGAFVIG